MTCIKEEKKKLQATALEEIQWNLTIKTEGFKTLKCIKSIGEEPTFEVKDSQNISNFH